MSWIYIDDAAAATVAALERGRAGHAYNVVDDEPVRWGEPQGSSNAHATPEPRGETNPMSHVGPARARAGELEDGTAVPVPTPSLAMTCKGMGDAMAEIELSAGSILYEDTGGEGPVIVLLHGLLWLEPALTNPAIRGDLRKYAGDTREGRRQLVNANRRLASFPKPVLVVWAAEDKVMPIQAGRQLAESFPTLGSWRSTIAGH